MNRIKNAIPSWDRTKLIFALALPIMGGMLSQNLFNLVDIAMVGSLGNEALAAVGMGGMFVFLSQSLLLGGSAGVQAMAARRMGEGRDSETAVPLNAALMAVAVLGVTLSILLSLAIPSIFQYMSPDVGMRELSAEYVQIRVLVVSFVGFNFAFRGYFNGVKLSRVYMRTLVIMHCSNIVLNYALIFGNFGFEAYGARGAGMASAASMVIGSLAYFVQGWTLARRNGFLAGIPGLGTMKKVLSLSLPNSIQQLFFSGGMMTLFWIIGQIGTVELATAHVMINLMLVCILPAMGMGFASATLVGQALGEKDSEQARQWARDVALLAFLFISAFGLMLTFFPTQIMGFFVHEQNALEVGRLPLQLTGLFLGVDAAGLVFMNSLLGAGDSSGVMKVSIFAQWVLFLPLAYISGPVFGGGLLLLWILQGLYRCGQGLFFFRRWEQGNWTNIQV